MLAASTIGLDGAGTAVVTGVPLCAAGCRHWKLKQQLKKQRHNSKQKRRLGGCRFKQKKQHWCHQSWQLTARSHMSHFYSDCLMAPGCPGDFTCINVCRSCTTSVIAR